MHEYMVLDQCAGNFIGSQGPSSIERAIDIREP